MKKLVWSFFLGVPYFISSLYYLVYAQLHILFFFWEQLTIFLMFRNCSILIIIPIMASIHKFHPVFKKFLACISETNKNSFIIQEKKKNMMEIERFSVFSISLRIIKMHEVVIFSILLRFHFPLTLLIFWFLILALTIFL